MQHNNRKSIDRRLTTRFPVRTQNTRDDAFGGYCTLRRRRGVGSDQCPNSRAAHVEITPKAILSTPNTVTREPAEIEKL
jgi:hypothetical protein